MFEIPGSKRVRRTDLESRSSSYEPIDSDPILETQFREQLEQIYADGTISEGIDGGGSGMIGAAVAHQPAVEDEENYEFRLFARPSAAGPSNEAGITTQMITLRSPTPLGGEPGFVNQRRSERYYFTGTASAELMDQYHKAAVSGETILEGLKVRWRGLEVPWRVTVIKSAGTNKVPIWESSSQSNTSKRKRIGKKRRIAVRMKLNAKSAMELGAIQNQADKEAAHKDKRMRKNREKKLKKRQKVKLKKAQETQIPDDKLKSAILEVVESPT